MSGAILVELANQFAELMMIVKVEKFVVDQFAHQAVVTI
jgi:hypothetical protein